MVHLHLTKNDIDENGLIKQQIIDKNFENITKVICHNINIIKFPLWPNIEEINCSDCTELSELPLWSNIKVVICNGCVNLQELPMWTTLKRIFCGECYSLRTLPLWLNVEIVYCSESLVKELPLWPNVKEVSCNKSYSLTKFPKWPKIRVIYCCDCSRIKELPLWFGAYFDSKVWFECEREKQDKMHKKFLFLTLIKYNKINSDLLYLINSYFGSYFRSNKFYGS